MLPAPLRRAVHQFHPGVAFGDAITNSMLLTRDILRVLGYRSDIFIEHPDDRLEEQFFRLEDLPVHDDYILIVLHSLGHERAEHLAALPAPKILMYHNITPASLLTGIPGLARFADLGRAQLDFWRDRTVAALAVSPFNAIELRRHGYRAVTVCPLLFDVDALRASAAVPFQREPDQPFTVLFVGRIVESKAQIDLVEAFAAFRAQFARPCRLVLVGRAEGGSDGYVAALYRRIGELGLRGVVTVTGQVSESELSDWYHRADLYVSLSRHEGFGVPLIEAMAHGIPVIAHGTGAVPYTMGGTGVLLATTDPAAAGAAMLDLSTSARRKAIIAAQFGNLDRFRLSRHVPDLLAALLRAGAMPPRSTTAAAPLTANLAITIAGHVNGTYSLAAVNRTLALALDEALPGRVRLQPVEQQPTDRIDDVPAADHAALNALVSANPPPTAPMVVISQHYPLYLPDQAADLAIAFFFWEESVIPLAMVDQLNRSFRAVLAPSQFVAQALVNSGVAIPVRVVGYAPPLDHFAALAAARTVSPVVAGVFTILHVSSTFPRKGVDLLLAAFAEAFPTAAAGTPAQPLRPRLVIKTFPNPHNDTAGQIARLQANHPDLPEIVLIDRDIPAADLLDLYRTADVMVLPTRGEGFNLPAAEAMAAGLPLIVTGGGGHADFTTEDDAILLPARREPSASHLAAAQSLWLAPDPQALVRALREVFADAAIAGTATAARAHRAHTAIMQRLDRSAWTRRVIDTTIDLLLTPPPPPRRFAVISSWDVRCGVAEYTRHLVTALAAHIAPHDQLTILTDHRTHERTERIGDHRVPVAPAWTQGGLTTIAELAAAVSRAGPDVLMIQHQPGLIHWLGLAQLLHDARLAGRIVAVTLHTTAHLLECPVSDQVIVLDALQSATRIIVHTMNDVDFLATRGLSDTVVLIAHGAPAPFNPISAPAPFNPISAPAPFNPISAPAPFNPISAPAPFNPMSAPAPLNPAHDTPTIGCYGFLLPSKGIGALIAALPIIRATWPHARLRLVNALFPAEESRAELTACTTLAAELGVTDAIEWTTDYLTHEESMLRLAGCDLLVLPYRHTPEASSAALRNCLASLTPTIVTPFPIFEEAGNAVARTADESPAAIAAAVIAHLADLPARTALRTAAQAWLGDRTWNAVARRTHGMLAGLAAAADPLPAAPDPIPAAAPDQPARHAASVPRPRPERAREPWQEPYLPLATKADIMACFRLLLGRSPNIEEWRGHAAHIGGNLQGVVASYVNSLEFARRGLMNQDVSSDIVITDLPDFRIVSDVTDDAIGKIVRESVYEPDVSAIFRRTLRQGMGVLDIGANIGYFSMLSAAIVGPSGQVFAVEPNQQNARLLEASRRLNDFGQITLIHAAAGAKTGILSLHTSHSTGTTSGVPDEIGALLTARIVPCLALDSIIPADRRIDLIKIDVDGAEYPAMQGCEQIIRRHRPAIISEFAPDLIPGISGVSGEDYLRWFARQDYEVAVIQPDGSLSAAGQDWSRIMEAYHRSGIDHIDIFATPLAGR
ncbi:FkbM family methyltransferase [Acidiphilium sp. PA]|uniref:FkbM family methyltransferase n=1 Tax=Acidiphilium sp. PA TaxID=2871705 RepID=UPI0022436FA4|nr:FkbM family methyltransferase [Acidiphilium sp. PA]MCW8306056.1 FkbM family methyltransferase [Acidiphilium sp. PA]